jgi:hypothetical protein
VYPDPIEYDLIGKSLKLDEVVNANARGGSRDFQADQAIVVCSGSESYRPRTAFSVEFDFGEYVLRGSTVQIRSTGKRGDACITRSQPSALGRQLRIRGAGPDNDPMRVITILLRDQKGAESSASLQFNCVATGRLSESLRGILAGTYSQNSPRSRSLA